MSRAPRRPLPELVRAAVSGRDPVALGRVLSYVESGGTELATLLNALPPERGRTQVIGVTGPPGAGKSTLTSALVARLRARGDRVAVLAVDPSSARSGGALLGDRIRMQRHDLDPEVVIRSLGSRGQLGGLSAAVPLAVRVLEACGFDTVVVETVGVGQSEIGVVALADTVLVVLAPGMGDGIQAEKAGLLEEADVFCVNKADRDDAGHLVRDLRAMLRLAHSSPGTWTVPLVRTIATSGDGADELLAALTAHCAWSRGSGEHDHRLRRRLAGEIRAVAAAERIRTWAERDREADLLETLVTEVLADRLGVVDAARRLV
ncbi:methylmalonyl Co-A mutase-associated GTPase MeaB [Nocardioides sp. LHD-245]|uniref:methylmalonyl Co-A mutase-associated GTPase MeaB n=1 Tax=Nocardioides sp. LHD-245 TaxID=3051387 RepID=UPI0027E1799E|nr:methylmalonyl Co-A mutase-associated GTPase MeaB [Nocardioides sp. LHD-245]